jgi:hypothetical protein
MEWNNHIQMPALREPTTRWRHCRDMHTRITWKYTQANNVHMYSI